MVYKRKPTLINNHVKSVHYMLETSKALNINNIFKDITMSYQQKIKNNINIFEILRDCMWEIIFAKWLRYSPIFCVRINFGLSKLINVSLNKFGIVKNSNLKDLVEKRNLFLQMTIDDRNKQFYKEDFILQNMDSSISGFEENRNETQQRLQKAVNDTIKYINKLNDYCISVTR